MTDWAKSGRRDTFRATLCDVRTLADVESVDIIPGNSTMTWSLGSETVYSGDISVLSDLGSASSRLIRIYHRCTVDDYDQERPIATMFIKNTVRNMKFKADDNRVSAYSTLLRFSDDKLGGDFYREPGSSILQGIRILVENRCGIFHVDQGVVDRNYEQEHYFEIGDNVMEVLQTMAGWLGCYIYPDANGIVHIAPNANAKDTPAVYKFTDRNSTYLPGVEVDDGRANVCNRSIVYYSIKESTGKWIEDSPATNPYSFDVTGRYIPIITKLTDREYSQEELREKALEVLHENDGAIKFLTIQHVFIPVIGIGDVVEYTNSTDFDEPFVARCVVTEMSAQSLGPGMMCMTKLKVVG